MSETFKKILCILTIFLCGYLCAYFYMSSIRDNSGINSRLDSIERRQQDLIREQQELLGRIEKAETLSAELANTIRKSRETVSGINSSNSYLQEGLSDTDKILRRDKQILEKYVK